MTIPSNIQNNFNSYNQQVNMGYPNPYVQQNNNTSMQLNFNNNTPNPYFQNNSFQNAVLVYLYSLLQLISTQNPTSTKTLII